MKMTERWKQDGDNAFRVTPPKNEDNKQIEKKNDEKVIDNSLIEEQAKADNNN